jgi:hypothetical protein
MIDIGAGLRVIANGLVLGLLSTACGNSSAGAAGGGAGANNGGASNNGATAGGGGLASSTNTAGSASGGASGGVSALAGAGGGAAVTKYQACVAYMNAQCNRRYLECRGFDAKPDPCPEFLRWCPDFLFSEDSQVDIPGALACAETWRNYSCDLLNQEQEPKCGLPAGKRALGEPCLYSRQCQSNECGSLGSDASHPDCGACIPVGVAGDPCYKAAIACPDGYECTGTGCQAAIHADLPDGELCERYGQCHGQSLCFPAPDGMMRCQPRRKVGEDCSNGAYCEPNAQCGIDNRCAAFVPVQLGELCSGHGCTAGGWCDNRAPNPNQTVCIAQANAGEPCQGSVEDAIGNCTDGLTCYCEGTGCTRACLYQRREGEACGDALSYCFPGTTCEAGRCVGVDLQGLAKAACGQ